MKKAILRLPLILPAIILCYGLTISNLIAQTEIGSREFIQLKQLKKLDPKLTIQRDKKTGSPTRLTGKLSESTNKNGKEIAKSFFNKNKTLFKMGDPEKELKIVKIKKDKKNWEHIKYQQVYKGINVENNMIIVHINSKKEIRVINGNYLPNIHLDVKSYIPRDTAIKAAIKHLNPKKANFNYNQAVLVVYYYTEKIYLSWKVTIFSEDPLGEFIYYLDANTGEYIHSYNNLNFSIHREIYDNEHKGSFVTFIVGTLQRSEYDPPTDDPSVNRAFKNGGKVYNYYEDNHGRDSFDDQGSPVRATVHYGKNFSNAFWQPSWNVAVFGDGDGINTSSLAMALDIFAHEFTHGVTNNESGLLRYEVEPGALNESLSDIFACLIDNDDWQIGETCLGNHMRYMNDPTLGNQPDHMNDFVINGDVDVLIHTNCGISNKAAYLIAAGGKHHGITVKGIGREKMGKLFYHMQTNWLTPKSTFLDAKNNAIAAAKNLFPDETWIHCSVQNAWAAVGLGDPCPTTPQHLSPTQNLKVIPVN